MTTRADGVALGVDVGTQGVRVLAVTRRGEVLSQARVSWSLRRQHGGVHEQDPAHWWSSAETALGGAVSDLTHDQRSRITSVAVTSTSGTLLLVDGRGAPLRPAIMWDDTRAVEEARSLAATDFAERMGMRARPSFPVAKLLWLSTHEPASLREADHICHASDWLLWRLGAGRPVSDPTNTLKTGYDVTRGEWIPLVREMGLVDKLPQVLPAGTAVGHLDELLADRLGMPRHVALVNTMTDANTASLAAGVVRVGDCVSTLGTGLSIKVLTKDRLHDLSSGVYSHSHPLGHWIVSGTSHCGASVIAERFGTAYDVLTEAARDEPAGAALIYPLPQVGEFFPFWSPEAEPFEVGDAGTDAGRFRATLEGVALNERLCFERLRLLGVAEPPEVRIVGGTTASGLFNIIRASALRRPVNAVAHPETAMGAAVTAFASEGSLESTVDEMIRTTSVIEPDEMLAKHYDDLRDALVQQLVSRGYLDPADPLVALA